MIFASLAGFGAADLIDHAAMAATAAANTTSFYARTFGVTRTGGRVVVRVPRDPDNTLILGMLSTVAEEARKHRVGLAFDVTGPFNQGQVYTFTFGGPRLT